MGGPLAIVGAGMTMLGGLAEGMQQRRTAQAGAEQAAMQSQIARNNAIYAAQQAEDARARGRVEAARQHMQTQRVMGQQRVGAAATGAVIGTGTAAEIVQETAALGRLDEETIRANAEREALGFQMQQAQFESEAGLRDLTARQFRREARTQPFTSLLTTGGTVASRFAFR
jgi:hypothetical protein